MISFFVPGDPRAKQSFHYAGRRSFTPARVKGWESEVGWTAQHALHDKRIYEPTPDPVEVELDFYISTRRRIDLDNLSKGTLDGLNGIIWVDDQQIQALTLRKSAPAAEPGVKITVWKITVKEADNERIQAQQQQRPLHRRTTANP